MSDAPAASCVNEISTRVSHHRFTAVEIGWPFRSGLEGCIVDCSQDIGWQRTFGHGRKLWRTCSVAALIWIPRFVNSHLSRRGCHGNRNAAPDGTLHLEPIVLWPSCYEPPKLEVIMTLAKISLASAAAITIISWGALAQENQNKGRITQLNHINGKITLQHAPTGTVGAAGASSLVDEYKIQDGVAKDLHAGDEVEFTAAQIGGVLTITKIQKK